MGSEPLKFAWALKCLLVSWLCFTKAAEAAPLLESVTETQTPLPLLWASGGESEAGVWQIASHDTLPLLWASDGEAINATRGGVKGASSRFIIGNTSTSSYEAAGFLDIINVGIEGGVYVLLINNKTYTFLAEPATLNLSSAHDQPIASNVIRVTGNGKELLVPLLPFPSILAADVQVLHEMMDRKLVPFANFTDAPGKTDAEILKLAGQFFPFAGNESSFALAMSVYDWTSPSFFRIVLFKHFVYTSLGSPPHPLDMPSVALMIWTSSWPPYTPDNKDFMHSLLMIPANSKDEVMSQLEGVADEVRYYVEVESRLISVGLFSMPRSSTITYPFLYSGQVDIYQYTTSRFLPLFLEFPGNAGPESVPLEMPINEGINTILLPGAFLTSKSFISFTTSEEDAMRYSNGILLILHPPIATYTWPTGAYVTPLSNDPNKIEYLMPPQTRYLILNISEETSANKTLLVINLQVVG